MARVAIELSLLIVSLVACGKPSVAWLTKARPTAAPKEIFQPAEWFSLRYDPAAWSLADQTPDTSLVIDWSRPVLQARSVPGCYVGLNVPRDFGPGIVLRQSTAAIGDRSWRVLELVSDLDNTPLPVRIYADDIAVEYGAEHAACLTAVVLVLQTYQPTKP